jgi:hypothetical protein
LALTPGTRLGVYEVTTQIGEGGMGQVYWATDTKLRRQVAIKILPASVAADHDRLARFRREAEVLASLNHPHVAGIYGFEESDGVSALVMELVEGEDLSQRIARGAIPIDEALPIAKQIAEALEAAHDQGIVHRDLKPANIKLRPDGVVKVLDFGLAKAEPVGAAASALSPTLTSPAFTRAGMILGTAAYMAPEQARGRSVDKRADIWAFGCVLYEMLTGRRAFHGDHVTDTLASIVKDEPDLSAAAPHVRRLLRKCLEKDPKSRLRDIGDAWDLLDANRPAPPHSRRAWIGWSVAGAIGLGAALLAIRIGPAQTPTQPTHLFLQISEQTVPVRAIGSRRSTDGLVRRIVARRRRQTAVARSLRRVVRARRTGFDNGSSPVRARADADGRETKWQVSSVFGREPRWRADSRELYYLELPNVAAQRFRVMAVPIETGAVPVGASKPLFELASFGMIPQGNSFLYAPAPDGRRFLVDMFASDARPTLDVILNWGSSERR